MAVHAWVMPHEVDAECWMAWRADATRVLRATSARLEAGRPGDAPGVLRGPEGVGLPDVRQERIALNGSGFRREAGDRFVVERRARDGVVVLAGERNAGRAIHRCDTRGQPYDLAVCALLLSLQRHLGNAMRLGSSGDLRGGWREAADVVRTALAIDGSLAQTDRGILSWMAAPVPPTLERVRSSA
jgi:hypothetical protein